MKEGQKGSDYFDRPLAPAPLNVLLLVGFLEVLVLTGVSQAVENDWVVAFVGVVALTAGWAALDVAGRNRAAREPNPAYQARRLPTERSILKRLLILLTLVVLVGVVGTTAEPGTRPSPLPYLLAVLFVALVIPQIVARRVIRRATGLVNSGAK